MVPLFALDTLLSAAPSGPVEVTRWRRFRHDRAYVRVNGVHVGYRDLRTGAVRAPRPEHMDLIVRATAQLRH